MTDVAADAKSYQRIRRILSDSDFGQHTRLLAVCFVVQIQEQAGWTAAARRRATLAGQSWPKELARLAGRNVSWVKQALAEDIPRYDADLGTGVCVGEMIRREGPCGKRIHQGVLRVNPQTGEKVHVGWCTRHWNLDYQEASWAAIREWERLGKPTPGPNNGGVLKRYFDADWPNLYAWAAPWRTPLDGAKEPTPPRPTLTVIQGGAS